MSASRQRAPVLDRCKEPGAPFEPLHLDVLSALWHSGPQHWQVGTPPRVFGVEDGLEYVAEDELVEITPKSVRLRKVHLKETDRKRNSRQRETV